MKNEFIRTNVRLCFKGANKSLDNNIMKNEFIQTKVHICCKGVRKVRTI